MTCHCEKARKHLIILNNCVVRRYAMENGGMTMAEYIECRNCGSPDCKGCNLKNLETMLKNGGFDCLMNENRCINQFADVAPVRHGRWISVPHKLARVCSVCNRDEPYKFADIDADVYDYCPNCGAKMDGGNG